MRSQWTRGSVTTALLLGFVILPATDSSAIRVDTDQGDPEESGDATIVLTAHEKETLTSSPSGNVIADPHPTRYKRITTVLCQRTESVFQPQWLREACQSNETVMTELECPPEAVALEGLWTSVWETENDRYGPWHALNRGSCLVAADLRAEAQFAFEVLTIPAPEPSIQPTQWALVNVHSPVSVTTPVQRFDVELLGIPVVLEATATTFTWNFGDGSAPLTTQDPGRAWHEGDPIPDESWVGHTWTRKGTYPVTMTTTWQGRFALAGTDAWEDVDGDVTTTSTVGPIQVLEARSQLVDGTLG
ncbi:hypothetical protein Xcel_1537 [Xylanimonas cellulosilytica DSM 15894]|uniref:PKD domain-containing protein n=2 Tax=Xylanimonas TaxID=186188 RepID=D1BS75_XYLCX|nr:hypothetical protein Xcel_1537 [Xylanimonas cellulosilytica DSM 15894]